MREAPLVNPRVYWSGRYEHYSSLIRHEIVRERERERETERQTERQRETETQRHRDRETERDREIQRDPARTLPMPRSVEAGLRPSLLVTAGRLSKVLLTSRTSVYSLWSSHRTTVNTNMQGGERRKDCKTEARYFIEFCIFCKVLALSPRKFTYKLAHNSYGQYCLTRITQTRYIFPVFHCTTALHTLKLQTNPAQPGNSTHSSCFICSQ